MSYAHDLLAIANMLLPTASEKGAPKQAKLRRAVSTAYYALFHSLTEDFAKRIIGTDPKDEIDRRLIVRALSHKRLRDRCEALSMRQKSSERKAFGAKGPPTFLENFCRAFVELQQERHRADYDRSQRLSADAARIVVQKAEDAIETWASANSAKATSAKARFALLLILDDAELKHTWR